MSMNQYMHPRNIYKQPPNFKQLALDFPEFRKHTIQDVTGKVSIDFKSTETLRALTCTLLKKDFSLDLEIPLNKLIPTVPLRYNYILWVEDLLNLAECSKGARGVDIGTGASCIYPLMGAKMHQWFMVATEIDAESIKYAYNNVKRNNLDGLVTVMEVKGDTLLLEALEKYPGGYDFCMCNPPFFGNRQELHPFFNARKMSRPRPKNGFCASLDEVVAKGGEVEYVAKLISESKCLARQVKIFTTMLGHKSSLPQLKKHLREVSVTSFKQTEFCQGHTTRWGLAWTFYDIDLTKIPDSLIASKQKAMKPLIYEVPKLDELSYKVSVISDKLLSILRGLQMECREIKRIKNLIEHIVVAYANTWSHQRRKRREKLKEVVCIDSTCDRLAELEVKSGETPKRSLEEDDGFYGVKRQKTEAESQSDRIFLKAKVSIVKVDETVVLELLFFEGTGMKEALHQVLQYIKNNLAQKEV